MSGRLINWAIELSEFDIEFISQNALKGKALVDFVAEFMNISEEEAQGDNLWVIHVDSSSIKKNVGARVVLKTPTGE